MRCFTCSHYAYAEMVESGKGLCKRYPPQAVQGNLYKSSFPVIDDTDWCGEYDYKHYKGPE